jgi:hypothetical protein
VSGNWKGYHQWLAAVFERRQCSPWLASQIAGF